VPLSAACVSCHASGKLCGREESRHPPTCSWVGEGQAVGRGGTWQRHREKPLGSESLLPVPGAVVSRVSGPIPATLLQICACPCLHLLFGLSGSLKFLLFCRHHPVSCHFLYFLSMSLPFWLPTCYYFILPTQPSSPFLGKTAVLGLFLPSALCLFAPLCSALRCSSNVPTLGPSVRLRLPMFNFLPVPPVPHCFLNFLPMSTFNQFPACVFYSFLPVFDFIAFKILFHLFTLLSLFLIFLASLFFISFLFKFSYLVNFYPVYCLYF